MRSIFTLLIERLPKFVELRDGVYGRNTRLGIDALLPHAPPARRQRVLAGVVRHRLINRTIFRTHAALPHAARRLAALVPITGPYASAMSDASAPLIIATGHFGPLFFALAALERRLRSRRVVVVLREGALYLRDVVPLLDALGFDYIVESYGWMRGLVRAMREDPRTVVFFAFDNPSPGRGRRQVPFLATTVATSTAIARLADLGEAKIVTTFWLWRSWRPRLAFDLSLHVDRQLDVSERRQRIVDELYRSLESQVSHTPEQWSGWDYVAAGIAAGANAAGAPVHRLVHPA